MIINTGPATWLMERIMSNHHSNPPIYTALQLTIYCKLVIVWIWLKKKKRPRWPCARLASLTSWLLHPQGAQLDPSQRRSQTRKKHAETWFTSDHLLECLSGDLQRSVWARFLYDGRQLIQERLQQILTAASCCELLLAASPSLYEPVAVISRQ